MYKADIRMIEDLLLEKKAFEFYAISAASDIDLHLYKHCNASDNTTAVFSLKLESIVFFRPTRADYPRQSGLLQINPIFTNKMQHSTT